MNPIPQRPAGLVAVVVITGTFAFLGLFFCGLALLLVSAADTSFGIVLLFLLCFALSVAEAVVCYGLWKSEDWGFELAQAVYALNIAIGAVLIFWASSLAGAIVDLVSLGVYIWMLIYVTRLKGVAPWSIHRPYDPNAGRTRPPT